MSVLRRSLRSCSGHGWLTRAGACGDPALAGRLFAAADSLHDYAEELVAAVPVSVDHSDVNEANAIVTDQGSVVILDWEEAMLGCPLLSLSRLLQDAEGYRDEITDAYTGPCHRGETSAP